MLDPELSSRYWLVRKVSALVGYYGGLRNVELRSIEFGQTFEGGEKSFEVDQSGYWFAFERGKQRGLPETSVFCVPRRQPDWAPVVSSAARAPVDFDPASVIDQYLHLLESDLKTTRDLLHGSFFKSTHGKNGKMFRNVPMGKNILAKVGFEFADELLLPNPQCFTGHCWRRSCGTNASDAGVNVTTLMAQLGWSTPKTAIGYVRKSRITSYQMSMFLSNVQRQNKDLDKCLALVRPQVVQPERKVGSSLRRTKSSVSNAEKKKSKSSMVIVPEVDQHLMENFSAGLFSAQRSSFAPSNLEDQKRESDKRVVLDLINQTSSGRSSLIPGLARGVSHESGVREFGHLGGGGGEGEVAGSKIGGGSGVDIGGSVVPVLDPRVSSILSNLQNHGEIHVHIHFK